MKTSLIAYKKLDVLIQLVTLSGGAIGVVLVAEGPALMALYFGMMGVQLVSLGLNLYKGVPKSTARRVCEIIGLLLFISLILWGIAWSLEQFGLHDGAMVFGTLPVITAMAMFFIGPFLSIFYLFICVIETKELKKI